MKITILGANSYIARNVIFELKKRQKQGDNIELNLYDYQEYHLDGERNYHCLDITNMKSVEKVVFDVDYIYMFIGKTGTIQGFNEYDSFININERALLNLLSGYVRKNSKARIIFPSTRLVYKGSAGKLKEDAEKEFKTIYAINKYACEQYLQMYNKMYNVQYVIFRICVPYGTMIANASSYGTAEFMLNKAKKGESISIYGDGSVRRTLTHMEDLCVSLLDGAMLVKGNDVYNIGGENYSLSEMAERIAESHKVSVNYVEWPKEALKIESGDTVFDSQKLDSVFEYHFKHTFDQWIKEI